MEPNTEFVEFYFLCGEQSKEYCTVIVVGLAVPCNYSCGNAIMGLDHATLSHYRDAPPDKSSSFLLCYNKRK